MAGAAARNPVVRNSLTSPLRALQVEDSTPDEDCTAENTARARREATESMTGWMWTWTAELDTALLLEKTWTAELLERTWPVEADLALLERTWAVEADSGAAAEDSG